jgi:hypothetical protein
MCAASLLSSGEIITRLKKGEEVTILEEVTLEKSKPGELLEMG